MVFFLVPLITFGAGVFAGFYINQNYEVPQLESPVVYYRKVKDFVDEYRNKIVCFVSSFF
ncbi:uncharacterized protein LOC119670079 [Teleopsis dalmanni]|uniref:uncharacterized protein LOC119670079 n=1 Tax=Teleopsis dalmanni TaxID=139649 RepID=UPI0018CF5D52|nr:uncharacterized protein LOC119670079 [Teleopsis dalmanni]